MDKGYDNDRILRETIARDCIPVVPLKKRRTSTVLPLVRNSQQFRDLPEVLRPALRALP